MQQARVTKMEQRSAATRAKVVAAAYDLFCRGGFRATTMEAIAEASGVAVQTVYFQFRTKADLLKAVHEWTVLGDESVPPDLQTWHLAAMKHPDARDALAGIVAGVATLNARIAPMLPIFDTLAQEPGGQIYRQSRQWRRRDMNRLVSALRAKTPLAPGVTAAKAADLLYFLTGPESYAELVLNAGWSKQRWVDWVSRTLCDQIFDTPQ